MTDPEPSIRLAVDPINPGQFFACCGLLELADRLWPGAEGWFKGGTFCVAPLTTQKGSLVDLLRTLLDCRALTERELLQQDASDQPTPVDAEPEADGTDEKPESRRIGKAIPKTDPVLLGSPICLCLNWWRRPDGTDNLFKTWAANATSQQMFRKWRPALQQLLPQIEKEPERLLELTARIQGSYGFDSVLGWDALDAGFSLNEHSRYKKLPTRPAVELLGAIGLQRFFPQLDERQRIVTYATWQIPLAPPVASVAALGVVPSVLTCAYRTRFVNRGTFKGLDTAIPLQGAVNE